MPALVITGVRDDLTPPGLWESTSYTNSPRSSFYYTGSTAIVRSWGKGNNCEYHGDDAKSFNDGHDKTDCRTYCSERTGWSKGVTNYEGVAD